MMRIAGDVPYEDLRGRVKSLGKTISPRDALRKFAIGNMACAGRARDIETAGLRLDDVSVVEIDDLIETVLAAVFADMGMALAVTLNGMRALRE